MPLLPLAVGTGEVAGQELTVGFSLGPELGPAAIRESCIPADEMASGVGADVWAAWNVGASFGVQLRTGVQSRIGFTCTNLSGGSAEYVTFPTGMVRIDASSLRGPHARIEARARLDFGKTPRRFFTMGAGILTNGVMYAVESAGIRSAPGRHVVGVEVDLAVYRVPWARETREWRLVNKNPPIAEVTSRSFERHHRWLPELRLRFFYELGLLR